MESNNNENGTFQETQKKKMSVEATIILTIGGTALFIVALGIVNYIYTALV